jgi:hypothetical protein
VSDTPRVDSDNRSYPRPEYAEEIIFEGSRHVVISPEAYEELYEIALLLERELNAANERIKRLRDGIAKQNLEIEQTCGKVLDYPWFKDDQKNFPEATEKDGVCVGEHVAETIAAELALKYTEAKDRIKRLEEAGDAVMKSLSCGCPHGPSVFHCQTCTNSWEAWRKAKEAKP